MRIGVVTTLIACSLLGTAEADDPKRQVITRATATERLALTKTQFKSPSTVGAIGFIYWFENAEGDRFLGPADAPAGSRLRLHLQSNMAGLISVILEESGEDATGTMLTASTRGFPGQTIEAWEQYVLPFEFPSPPGKESRLLMFFSRSQTEQVGTAANARWKIDFVSSQPARDGRPPILIDVDVSQPNELGTYVVHREGGYPCIAVALSR